MPHVKDLLKTKGSDVVTILSGARVADAIEMLIKRNIGALVVVAEKSGEYPVGIVTERDILRATQKGGSKLESLLVADVMSKDLIIAFPSDDLSYVMSTMTKNRVRHLPVMQSGVMVGLVSIGDVIKSLIHEHAHENRMLRDYIEGKYPN